MVKCKVKILSVTQGNEQLETKINEFLDTIDVRQILKIDYAFTTVSSGYQNQNISYPRSCMITYVGLDDIRELKLDTLLNSKI